MSQTQKSPAPVAAGCEAQYQNKHPDYSTIARRIKANRRYSRTADAILSGPVDRPDLDKIVGTTNSPWYGRYHLSKADRDGLRHALAMLGVK